MLILQAAQKCHHFSVFNVINFTLVYLSFTMLRLPQHRILALTLEHFISCYVAMCHKTVANKSHIPEHAFYVLNSWFILTEQSNVRNYTCLVVWFCKWILNLSVMLQLAGETALCLTTMSTQNFGLIEPSGSTTVYLFGAVHRTETVSSVPKNISSLQGIGMKTMASGSLNDTY